MTRPVYNLSSPIVDIQGDKGYLRQPWNSFFQQFVQNAPTIADALPFAPMFTANQNGTVIVYDGVGVTLHRGQQFLGSLEGSGGVPVIIPVSVGDGVSWVSAVAVWFLGS